ncbi:MAG: hypothetical protein EXQ51_13850, partial [Acidobacteria bacterium]|nr:hypothetical protein [Acidobacteriota bacterium]
MDAIEVGVLGATGMVGQQFVSRLSRHPWFRCTWLAASERSAGKTSKSVAPWKLNTVIPGGAAACAGPTRSSTAKSSKRLLERANQLRHGHAVPRLVHAERDGGRPLGNGHA